METTSALVRIIDARIDALLNSANDTISAISADGIELVDSARQLLTRGKRFRPQFCYWGWRAISDIVPGGAAAAAADPELAATLDICVGLEFFHAAALVHDDIIDNSDTRRGAPSQHRSFAARHLQNAWTGDADTFGTAAAIILGDLLLAWSHECFTTALGRDLPADRLDLLRARLSTMQTQVMVGQYLDVREEHAWPARGDADAERAARTILTYKSARYSVESPLVIGATVGGASVGQIDSLREFGLAIGQAFQLRDDVLGVFGDPEETGKPAGDDLKEGKRTLLIVLTRPRLAAGTARLFDEMLGDPGLESAQIDFLRRTIVESGALDAVEEEIARLRDRARAALAQSSIGAEAHAELLALADAATTRRL